MNIDELSGFDLNRAIAESKGLEVYLSEGDARMWVIGEEGTPHHPMPDWSRDPAAALGLLEEFPEYDHLRRAYGHKVYIRSIFAVGTTFAEAACRCYLMAMEERKACPHKYIIHGACPACGTPMEQFNKSRTAKG